MTNNFLNPNQSVFLNNPTPSTDLNTTDTSNERTQRLVTRETSSNTPNEKLNDNILSHKYGNDTGKNDTDANTNKKLNPDLLNSLPTPTTISSISACQEILDSNDGSNNTTSLENDGNTDDTIKGKSSNSRRSRLKRKYNFQRASIACEQCRKAKTRCNYINNGSSCFRCENLSLNCSLHDSKITPSLSTFQSSAHIKTRDQVDKEKSRKKKKFQNLKSIPLLDNNLGTSSATSSSIFSKGDYSTNSTGSSSVSSSSPNDISKTDYLSAINEKIDRLSSIVSSLVEKDYLNSNNNGSSNSVQPSLPFTFNQQSFLQPQNMPLNPGIQHLHQQHQHSRSREPSVVKGMPQTLPQTLSQQLPQSIPLSTDNYSTNSNINNNTLSNSLPLLHPPPQPFQLPLRAVPSVKRPVWQPVIAPLARSDYSGMKVYESSSKNANNSNSTLVHENDEFFFLNAPYLDVTNIAANLGLAFTKEIGFDVKKDTILLSIQERYDIINRNLLDYETCFQLVEISLVHYGKLITYAEVDFKQWFDHIRYSSPLLFCILVLLGFKHKKISNKVNVELDILQSIHQLLSLSIYEIPQTKEFLQASILLTHYSQSLSCKHVYFDSWWISSYGLIHFVTREMNLNLLVKSVRSPEKIHQYRIWNHLTLAHITNCILSGRPCIIDEIRLDQCRDILDLPEANAFDAVTVGQLCLIVSIYNSLQFPEKIETSLKDLDSTYNDWKYIIDKVSFGETISSVYYVGKLLILRRYILTNIYNKKQPEFDQMCKMCLETYSEMQGINTLQENLIDATDTFKQCEFFAVFMLLQFKQLDLFDSSSDFIVIDYVNKYLEVNSTLNKKLHYYNDYLVNYAELIIRMKNAIFPHN